MRFLENSPCEPRWNTLEAEAVLALMPQRPPFLFVDGAQVETEGGQVRTWRRFRAEEPYFEGHFPGDPIVPGVVLLECMAQAGRLLLNARTNRKRSGYLVRIHSARFNHALRPGDVLRIEAHLQDADARQVDDAQASTYTFRCLAYVGDKRCARAQIVLYRPGFG